MSSWLCFAAEKVKGGGKTLEGGLTVGLSFRLDDLNMLYMSFKKEYILISRWCTVDPLVTWKMISRCCNAEWNMT